VATKLAVLSVAGIGAATVACTALWGAEIINVIGGADYIGLSPILWLFATAGAMYAVGQAVLLSRIAQADRRSVIAVWMAGGILCVIAIVWARSITGLVLCACVAGASLCLTSFVVLFRENRSATHYCAGQADGR
jgi:O-antigen/teichoic acid export membrane protein